MIKRRFYRLEHGNKDDPYGSSSSSDDSEVEGDALDQTEDEEYEVEEEEGDEEKGEASSSSGYESEDRSVNEVNLDSSAEDIKENGGGDTLITAIEQSPKKEKILYDNTNVVLKCKSVLKCKLCPRIVCLSEETLKAHLSSKRHARSEKQLKEGRLKLMLNDKGEIEAETHSHEPVTTAAPIQQSSKPKKKRKGPWKQRKRSIQEAKLGKTKPSKDKREKRRKNK